jgi:CDP-diacylglycerol--glycerol-3-phosphate 3-phosphatidyltransferase
MHLRLFDIKNYNSAEWLPLVRLISIPFILLLVFLNQRHGTALLFLLSFCTDAVDGFVGRTFHMNTRRLQRLDSLADMSLLSTGLIAFLFFEFAFAVKHLISLSGVLSLYILQVFFALKRYGKVSSFHTLAARFAAVVQTLFITFSLFYEPKVYFYYFTVAISLFETLGESALIAVHRQYPGHVNSIVIRLYRKFRSSRQP